METKQLPIEDMARIYARTAHEGFATAARYFRTLPADGWDRPTGCAKWNMRTLAGHIVGEAVWFPNLVRGATQEEAPLPSQLYEDLKNLPAGQLADRTEAGAAEIEASVEAANREQLSLPVDLGFAKLPIWMATSISTLEAVLHEWDTRARQEDRATIPTSWAQTLAGIVLNLGSEIAHRSGIDAAPGIYLLKVGDGVGPVTLTVGDGKVDIVVGQQAAPDVTLHLSADQYVRLLTGRCDLSSAEGLDVRIEGERARAAGLNQVFSGIAN